ncbi:MAG: Uma2 family endonuclease [Trichodesmium sp.]
MMQDTLLKQLLNSPQLVNYYQTITEFLEKENQTRQSFYQKLPTNQKTEFINGEVIIYAPDTQEHNQVKIYLLSIIDTFVVQNNLGKINSGNITISLSRNDYQPDICFFTRNKSVDFTSEQIKFPAPDFIVEILSPNTEDTDRGVKFIDYANHGVTEYLIIDPQTQIVEQYILEDGEYNLHIKSDSGNLTTVSIPYLTIPITAIFDETENMQILEEFFML